MKFSDYQKQQLLESFSQHNNQMSFFVNHFLLTNDIAHDLSVKLLDGKRSKGMAIRLDEFDLISLNDYEYCENGDLKIKGTYFDGEDFRSFVYLMDFNTKKSNIMSRLAGWVHEDIESLEDAREILEKHDAFILSNIIKKYRKK